MNTDQKGLPDCILLYCRAGFEKECAIEILDRAASFGVEGLVKARPASGFVVFIPAEPGALPGLRRSLRFADLIFARQLIFAFGPVTGLSPGDRLRPLLEPVREGLGKVSEAWLETADTNEAKALSGFVRKFSGHFQRALAAEGLLGGPELPRLHVFFLNSAAAYLGTSLDGNSSPWPMGIPRLRFPRTAPSRSTLKLEEAFLMFLKDPDHDLRPGMTAVDLGAAPGGWTWQLVRRHCRTIAVDNGPLAPALLESGLVEHRRTDAFRFRPGKPVDWLVCDIVEQPARCAALVADWIAGGLAPQAIFNLKLPMRKRYEEVLRCRGIMEERVARAGLGCRLSFKQLYHDRAEVTGYIVRSPAAGRSGNPSV